MTTVTKQPERGGGLNVKDIHPFNGALSLKLKQLLGRLSSLPALWRALTQCGALKTQKQTLSVFWATALHTTSPWGDVVCQCVKGHMVGAVLGKASEHSNLQRLNLSLMHVFWFDSSSHQQSMWNHWPYQKLGISHMWSTGGKVCQNVSRRAPLFPAPLEASFCFQLRKWLMTVCRVQVSMCSQLWPWTPINWPAPPFTSTH